MFLDHFDKQDHGLITQFFRNAFCEDHFGVRRETRRTPAKNLTEMLENLERDLEVRAKVGSDMGMRESILDSELLSDRKAFARMVAAEEQKRYGALKTTDVSHDFQKRAMGKKPPSEAQLGLLRKLGFKGTVSTMAEASLKIGELKRLEALQAR